MQVTGGNSTIKEDNGQFVSPIKGSLRDETGRSVWMLAGTEDVMSGAVSWTLWECSASSLESGMGYQWPDMQSTGIGRGIIAVVCAQWEV